MGDTHPYPFSERHEVVPLVPEDAKVILDVGCGLGGFGYSLRQANPSRELWGIEEHAETAVEAEPFYDHLVVGSFPFALDDRAPLFDCIVFNDVLEHMVDPWSALRASHVLLSPGGTIVASIPNVRYVRTLFDLVLRGDWTYTNAGVLDRTHLRFFTRRTAVRLLEETGFQVEHVSGINWIGHHRFRWSRRVAPLLGEMAYTGFVLAGRPATAT